MLRDLPGRASRISYTTFRSAFRLRRGSGKPLLGQQSHSLSLAGQQRFLNAVPSPVRLSSQLSRNSFALRIWRALPQRPRFLGTWSIILANCTAYGLYSIAPSAAERRWQQQQQDGWWRRLPWQHILQQPPVQQSSQGIEARAKKWLQQYVPTTPFWKRHFFASYWGVVEQHHVDTLLLANFMHVSLQHLAFNMLTLFFFGRQVELMMGLRKFVAFYLASGVASVTGQVYACGRDQPHVRCVGASGAVYALLAYITCCMPGQTVHLYFIIPVPLWAMMVGLLTLDVFMITPFDGHAAHLIGAACGVLRWSLR